MRVTEFAEKYDMFPREGKVLCALSGGRDSMCLLHILLELAPQYGFSVACAHYNHRLRGEESDRDARFVEEYCRKLGIPVHVGCGDVMAHAREKGLSVEEAARELRYAFLERTADEIGAQRIATAHNAEDNAETVLLNLIRGTGLSGLGGIPPVRGRIIRPLLKVTRAEIESYLKEKGIPHVEDSTNARDDYFRNRLRHGVLPLLIELNPAFVQNVSRAADLLREDEEFIAGLARDFIRENMSRNGESAALPAKTLSELPDPVSARVFRMMAGGGLSAVHIEALRRLCSSGDPSASVDLPGMRVIREYDKVVFSPPKWEKIRERALLPGRTVEIPEAELIIKCEYFEKCPEIHNSLNTFFFKYETICGNLSVRSRRDGDKIRILGRNCTKSLKKLFQDAKLTQRERDLTPVLADKKGALAVYGFGMDERCAALPGDRAIKIEIIKTGEE